MPITVDGIQWNVECQIERVSEIRASDISGLLLDGSQFNDVLGQYLRYDIALVCPMGMETEYAELYEALTAPVDGHSFVLPYNNGTITITARVESIHDVRYPVGDGQHWAGTKFTAIANHPTKFMSLDDVLARGGTPLPDLSDGSEGDYWHCEGANGWVHGNYPDCSEMYF